MNTLNANERMMLSLRIKDTDLERAGVTPEQIIKEVETMAEHEDLLDLLMAQVTLVNIMGQIALDHAPDRLFSKGTELSPEERVRISMEVVPLELTMDYVNTMGEIIGLLPKYGLEDIEKTLRADGMLTAMENEVQKHVN
jgi:hypothetical protein